MSLSVGIVGLPNVGKSTLFNALLQKQQALAANYPFATIDPNVGIVPVPDTRLPFLAEIVGTEKLVPATVEFVDIAGLVAGASKGEGLGNQFLAHIRETQLIVHVVRVFADSNIIREGSTDPASDYTTILTELQLADLNTLQKQTAPKGAATPEAKLRWERIERWQHALNAGELVSDHCLDEEERSLARELGLLTAKRSLVVANVAEDDVAKSQNIQREVAAQLGREPEDIVVICAKIEEEVASLDPAERTEYLGALGIETSGLEQLIRSAYHALELQSFYTAGEKEARAWTIPQGTPAPQAAGVIHTDFVKHFIRANVASYTDFVTYQGWKGAKERGKVRQEGKTYIMQSDDVVEFLIGSS